MNPVLQIYVILSFKDKDVEIIRLGQLIMPHNSKTKANSAELAKQNRQLLPD